MNLPPQPNPSDMVSIEDHYTMAGMDYRHWSPSFNMHFGYWRGHNPFVREPMLKELTYQCAQRMILASNENPLILDMGCGVGAPLRDLVELEPKWKMIGITKVPWQIEMALQMTSPEVLGSRAQFELRDFTRTGYPDNHFDSVLAMESLCHGGGLSKVDAIREVSRILKPGGGFMVADGFLTRGYIPWLLKPMFNKIAHDWAFDTFIGLPQFKQALVECGLELVSFENISFRIAPTALQTPWVSLKWLIDEGTKEGKISLVRWRHVAASLLAPLVGLAMPWFCYGLVVIRKKTPTNTIL
jgi:SAM-dependent methyltransferase